MFADEDDEDATGAVRYPCMPSLVSLQQMRNRLHLAYLGRKLMKWTTMATGRELRRLAIQIYNIYDAFGDDLRNAFMLLARGRYFYPNLNKMVLENCPPKASVIVYPRTKSVSGVQCTHYEVEESGIEPYEHLGIEKGGQQIHAAKIAWLEILKRLVLMLELRNNFVLIEIANRNANKRQNVLSKVVVPRTLATLAYISNELEEAERENFFRLKKVLEKKGQKKKCHHTRRVGGCESCKLKFKDQEDSCPICGLTVSMYPKIEPIKEGEDVTSQNRISKTDSNILEAFKSQIADIIVITEDIKERGMVESQSESVERFLKTASELRDKLTTVDTNKTETANGQLEPIHSDVSIDKLCEICIKRYEDERAEAASLAKKKEEDKQIDLELGVFETEYQQITKIIRVKNEDGTVTEEKKVIKKKKEIKVPVKAQENKDGQGGKLMFQNSGTSSKSTPYGCSSKTVGIVSMKDRSKFKFRRLMDRKVQSETLFYVSSLTSPIVRYCISSASMMCTSNDFKFCCSTLIENNDYDDDSSQFTLTEIYTSSLELEEATYSFKQSMTENSESYNNVHLKTD